MLILFADRPEDLEKEAQEEEEEERELLAQRLKPQEMEQTQAA